MAEKKPVRKPAPKRATPQAKGVNHQVKQKVTSQRKPSAPKPVLFSIPTGGGIWYKIRQNNILFFDEEKGHNRELRYCPAEKSVFKDDQSDVARREQIVFRDGTLQIPYTSPNLIEFLRKHPDNINNGGQVFLEVNNEVDAEAEVNREFAMHDAIAIIKTTALEDLIPVALSYGISADLSSMEIKRALLQQAKADPLNFVEAVSSPIVKLKADVITAIDFQILKVTADGMYWFDSNTLIMPTPLGQDTVSVFTRFLMTDKGNPVRDELDRQLGSL